MSKSASGFINRSGTNHSVQILKLPSDLDYHMNPIMKKPILHNYKYVKTKKQLTRAFVFTTWIVQSLIFLNLCFIVLSVAVPGWKPKNIFNCD